MGVRERKAIHLSFIEYKSTETYAKQLGSKGLITRICTLQFLKPLRIKGQELYKPQTYWVICILLVLKILKGYVTSIKLQKYTQQMY